MSVEELRCSCGGSLLSVAGDAVQVQTDYEDRDVHGDTVRFAVRQRGRHTFHRWGPWTLIADPLWVVTQ